MNISLSIYIPLIVLLLSIAGISDGYAQKSFDRGTILNTITQKDTILVFDEIRKGQALEYKAPDSALAYYYNAYNMSKSMYYADGQALAVFNLARMHNRKGNLETALHYFLAAIPVCKASVQQQKLLSAIHGNIGNIYIFQGKYELAASYYDSSLSEELRFTNYQSSRNQASTYINLSRVYYRLKQYDKVYDFAQKAEAISRNMNYPERLALALNNKAEAMLATGNYYGAANSFQEMIKIGTEHNDRIATLSGYTGLGHLSLKQNNPDKALEYLNKAGSIADPQNPYHLPFEINYLIGNAHFQLKQYRKAEDQLLKSLQYAYTIGFADDILNVHKILSEIYTATGRYKMALEHQTIYLNLKDSLLSNEKAKEINELEIKYRSSEKDRELAIKEKELVLKNLSIARAEVLNRRQATWIWIISLGTLLLAMSIVLLRYRQLTREKQLQQQKALDLLKATMDGEEAERVRVGKELHDGVSSFLSAIKMNLVTLRMQRKDIAQESTYMHALSLADEAADELRKTAHNLVPSNLVKKGLTEAIKGFCERLSLPGSVTLEVQVMGSPIRLKAEKELSVYRIVQELIHNIIKHARASEALVIISWMEGVLMVTIEDNGIGMLETDDSKGIGIDNIRKRVQSVNGTLEIENGEDSGTSMYLYFPSLL